MVVLVMINSSNGLYSFRKELLQRLINEGHVVYVSAIPEAKKEDIEKIGCKFIDTNIDRRGSNIFKDCKLFIFYLKILRQIKPDIIFTYTIKPNIYGSIAARIRKIKSIHTVTGLGSVYIRDMWIKKIVILLNKFGFKKANKIYFLNNDNLEFYKKIGILSNNQECEVVPGSGVNIDEFKFSDVDLSGNKSFTFIARLLKDKGIGEFLEAAEIIRKKYSNIEFNVVGYSDEEFYLKKVEEYDKKGIIKYFGYLEDVKEIITNSTCVVLPSYGEGRGTVLQEAASMGRAIITCDTYGTKETVEQGYNGFLCKVADVDSLVKSIENFINLSDEQIIKMSKNSRDKAIREFDRKIVIDSYIKSMNNVLKGEK